MQKTYVNLAQDMFRSGADRLATARIDVARRIPVYAGIFCKNELVWVSESWEKRRGG